MSSRERPKLMMTDGEIRASYRQAKNPREQVKILSELNACSVDRICEILGIEVPRRKNTVKYLPHKWTDKDITILYNMLRSGYGYAEIGEIIGVSKTAVMLKMREQWGGRAAVGRRGQRNSKTKKEKGNDDEMDGTTNWGGSRKKLDAGVIEDIQRFSADGLKNTEIAERLGISISSVSRYLNGGRKMPDFYNDKKQRETEMNPSTADAVPLPLTREALENECDEDYAYLLEDRDRIAAERDALKVKCDALSDANAKLKEKNKILSVTVDAGREIELREENEKLRAERDELIRNIESMQKDLLELRATRAKLRDFCNKLEAVSKERDKLERDVERYRSAGDLIERLNARCRNYRLENTKLRRAVGCVLEECAYLIVPALEQDADLPEIEQFYNIAGDLVFKAKKEDVPAATETSGRYAL